MSARERSLVYTGWAWIAYASNESGQAEIYVRPLSGDGGQVKVSQNGGLWPMWSPDGTESIYLDNDVRKLMAARFSTAGGEMLDYPRAYALEFDVTGAPLRILTDEDLLSEDASVRPPKVVVGWFEELERKVPARQVAAAGARRRSVTLRRWPVARRASSAPR